jgi:hypothetical protein
VEEVVAVAHAPHEPEVICSPADPLEGVLRG